MNKKIIICAGGTGGHVYPALVIAQKLEKLGHWDILWVGAKNKLEERVVPESGFKIILLKTKALRGKGKLIAKLSSLFGAFFSLVKLIKLYLKESPDLVLGMGGFTAGPGGIAAKLLNIPLIIHEQNAIPGLTNSVLSLFANKVLMAYPNSFKSSENYPEKFSFTGNPLRSSFDDLLKKPILKHYNHLDLKPFHILILGGSLGSLAINQSLPRALEKLSKPILNQIKITHICGSKDLVNSTRSQYRAYLGGEFLKSNCILKPYIDSEKSLVNLYKKSHLIIARSGALTVSEVQMSKTPVIFIPYPYAVDDHQFYNAKNLVNLGAGFCLRENEIQTNPELLAQKIKIIFKKYDLFAQAYNNINLTEAVSDLIVRHCLNCVSG